MIQEPCKKCGEYHNNCYELAELTDEEIDEVDEANWDADHKVWGIREFARAILRKAQEK